MRLLLTGGAGFIGSHIAVMLLEKGYNVVIFDSFINSSVNVIKSIKTLLNNSKSQYKLHTIKGDIRDKNSLDKVFKDSIKEGNPIKVVVHLAGLKSVSESIVNPLNYWDVNVAGTKNLLETMMENQCNSIVFSSSATIYGLADSIPISEDHKILPINPYGKTKAAIENMLDDLFKSNSKSWKICSLRYFNPVGAHPSGLIGEDPMGIPNNLFPYLYQVLIGRRKFLKVFGNDWDTKDGSGVRDYIHIMDLCEGHIDAIEYLIANTSCYEFINLGSGKGYSVFQIINEFELLIGSSIPYSITSRRIGDVSRCYADITKAKQLIGWFPKRSLKQMCSDGLNWQRKNPNGYS